MDPLLGITAKWDRTSPIQRSRELGGNRSNSVHRRQQTLSYPSLISAQEVVLLTHAASCTVCWILFCQEDPFLSLLKGSIAVYLSNTRNVKLLRIECALHRCLVEHTGLSDSAWEVQNSGVILSRVLCSHSLEKMFIQDWLATHWAFWRHPTWLGCPSICCIADLLELTACWNSEWASQDRGSPTLLY